MPMRTVEGSTRPSEWPPVVRRIIDNEDQLVNVQPVSPSSVATEAESTPGIDPGGVVVPACSRQAARSSSI
jgi:hypothetical protein